MARAKNRSYRFTFGPWNISTGADPFGERLLAALRQQFGGHAVQPAGSSPVESA